MAVGRIPGAGPPDGPRQSQVWEFRALAALLVLLVRVAAQGQPKLGSRAVVDSESQARHGCGGRGA